MKLHKEKLHKESRRLFVRFRHFLWLLIGVWSGCIVGSLIWNLRQQANHSLQMARRTAQISFENDVLYRRWSAKQGGVYVRVSKDTPPNPYLRVPDRDVTTTSGVPLTLVNPAYMARQVNSLASDIGGSRGHLTSLKPIRPENAPDAWETAALRSFEEGVPEVSSVEEMADGLFCQADSLLEQMQAALGNGAGTALANTAHRLKGTVAYLGAAPTLEATKHVETIARCGDLSAAPDALERLTMELDRLKDALDRHQPTGQ